MTNYKIPIRVYNLMAPGLMYPRSVPTTVSDKSVGLSEEWVSNQLRVYKLIAPGLVDPISVPVTVFDKAVGFSKDWVSNEL